MRKPVLIALGMALAVLPSCRETAKDTGSVETGDSPQDTEVEAVDADGDGFADDVDCDDTDADVHPEATEACDGIDNDCDGLVDDADDAVEGTSSWYADVDGDGYGNAAAERTGCEAPSGYSADNTDCDDLNADFHPGADESDCTDENDYNCDGSVGYADADGDGFAACEDCDDAAASIHPMALEVCDSVDNNCDGDVDEDSAVDSTTWYADTDADGYGDAATPTEACEAPSAYVADDTDCDDSAADIHPSALEVCDSADNDCDGWIDDTDPDVSGTSVFYYDADGDGYGGQQLQVSACVSPNGYVSSSDDCDDLDATSYPGASETCDSADNDCDGDVDEGVGSTWYQDNDGDGYGNGSMSQEACDAPSGYVGNSLDCDDFNATSSPASFEVCDGVDNDCDGTIDEPDAINVTTFYADGDGDGYGTSTSSTTACEAPSNHSLNSADCNDADPAVNPSATEACDSIDNDCDGAVDELGSTGSSMWYADADGDGLGNPSDSTESCSQPSGFVADSTDCDDADGGSTSSADDADCDGTPTAADCDDGDPSSTTVATDGDCDGTVTALDCNDADASSTTVAADGDCDGYETASDCNDADSAIHPGATEVCDTVDHNCDGSAFAGLEGSLEQCAGTSCKTILDSSSSTGDGLYWLDPDGDGTGAFQAYCEMSTAGGGWSMAYSNWFAPGNHSHTNNFLSTASSADVEYSTTNHTNSQVRRTVATSEVFFRWGQTSGSSVVSVYTLPTSVAPVTALLSIPGGTQITYDSSLSTGRIETSQGCSGLASLRSDYILYKKGGADHRNSVFSHYDTDNWNQPGYFCFSGPHSDRSLLSPCLTKYSDSYVEIFVR